MASGDMAEHKYIKEFEGFPVLIFVRDLGYDFASAFYVVETATLVNRSYVNEATDGQRMGLQVTKIS